MPPLQTTLDHRRTQRYTLDVPALCFGPKLLPYRRNLMLQLDLIDERSLILDNEGPTVWTIVLRPVQTCLDTTELPGFGTAAVVSGRTRCSGPDATSREGEAQHERCDAVVHLALWERALRPPNTALSCEGRTGLPTRTSSASTHCSTT